MAYTVYTGLADANAVITQIYNYVVSKGYAIAQPLRDDLNIYDMSTSDGKRFCFKNRTGQYYIVLRSTMGNNIFGIKDDYTMDNTPIESDPNYYGIGMTVAEGYSDTGRWYNQYNVPVKHRTDEVQGVFIPIPNDGRTYTLWCNEVTSPNYSLVFTVMPENSIDRPVVHLIYADVDKYEEWNGGAFFSGSCTRYQMKTAYQTLTDSLPNWHSNTTYNVGDIVMYDNVAYECTQQHTSHYDVAEDSDYWQQTTAPDTINADNPINVLPVLCTTNESNSFLRIDIDEAPSDLRGNIIWASSGADNITGKPMALPIRGERLYNGEIPHYRYLQSESRLDWGRNTNTLNCITINMPIFIAVQVDPDVLKNYAAVGVIPGISFISTLNVQTGYTYEMSYPSSGSICQAFPMTKRRGWYGYDGISIRQEVD